MTSDSNCNAWNARVPNLPELLISTKWEVDVCAPFCLATILFCKAFLDTLSIIIMRIIFARVIRNIQLLHLSEGKGKLEREFFRVSFLAHEGWTSSVAQKIKKLSKTPVNFPLWPNFVRTWVQLLPHTSAGPHCNYDGKIEQNRDLAINFWLGCPIDPTSSGLNSILHDLFRDTP